MISPCLFFFLSTEFVLNFTSRGQKMDRDSPVQKKQRNSLILVNNVNFSPLYNTGICSWHSLKRTVRQNKLNKRKQQKSHVCSLWWQQLYFFFLLSLYVQKKPLRSTVQKVNVKKQKKLEGETKQNGNKRHRKPRQTELSQTTEKTTQTCNSH